MKEGEQFIMKILVVNAGSSSLKYQLFDMDEHKVLAKGLCEKIGLSGAITHKRPGKPNYEADYPMPTHDEAIALVLKLLTDPELGVIDSVDEISAVGHRFAHGGKFTSSRLLGDEEMNYLEEIIPINPLHGPPAIKGVNACRKIMKDVPMVGVFDTSYYATIEPKAYTYALPYEWFEKYGVRRYGFHGTSHRFVAAEAAKFVGKPLDELKIVTCHIGSGSSITATKFGKAVDTSMGFTPQEGLPMGTRCGSIDPSVITYVMKKTGMTPDEMDTAMNKKSGLLGVSGVSNDAREVWAAADAGNERAQLALVVRCHGAKKLIGSYVAEMNGVDVLVFTAGLGENDRKAREVIASDLDFLGIKLDKEKNLTLPRGINGEISTDDSPVKILVLPTDEEFMIAADTQAIVEAL